MDGMVAGFYWAAAALRDSNGYPKGQNQTPDIVANKTLYTPYRLKHPVSYTPAEPTREEAQRRGGQVVRGRRALGVSSYGAGTIVLDSYDETFHALISRSKVDTATLTGVSMTSQNANEADPPALVLLMSLGFTRSDGVKGFLNCMYHNVQIAPTTPAGSQDGGVNPNPLTHALTVDQSPRTGMGLLFTATALDVAENSDTLTIISSADPYFYETWIADGTETSFTLSFLPLTSDATGGATNLIAKNGVKTAVTSVNTSTGVVTLTSAGSAGDIWTVFYSTRFVTP